MKLENYINPPTPQEPEIDCKNCSLSQNLLRDHNPDPQIKCCDFQPFLSAFNIGRLLADGFDFTPARLNLSRNNLLPVGLLPNAKFRVQHSAYRDKKSNSDKKFVCSFFESNGSKCSLWNNRPLLCRFYFCASGGGAKQLQKYERTELSLQSLEAQLLKEYLLQSGYSDLDWEQMTNYLDKKIKAEQEIQYKKYFLAWDEAKDFYLKSWLWLKQKTN